MALWILTDPGTVDAVYTLMRRLGWLATPMTLSIPLKGHVRTGYRIFGLIHALAGIMNTNLKRLFTLPACLTGFVVFSVNVLIPSSASADIIKIQSLQACNIVGLDSSPATAQGGVHCNTGNTPFSLLGVLNGSIPLFVGNSQTPSWNVINDTGSPLTSLTLYYSGALASNAFIDMQISGTTIFQACAATTATLVVTSDASCGSGDVTGNNPALPLKMVWSGGTGVAVNGTFNIGTASFAHAGEDAGCISGTPNCQSVPEPSILAFLVVGLLSVAGVASRQHRR